MTKNQFRIFFDMDGTLAEWREKCSFSDLYQKDYFGSLKPHTAVCQLASDLQNAGLEIYILSAYLTDSPYALNEKQNWCDRHTPFIQRKNRIFTPSGITDAKVSAIKKRFGKLSSSDILIDDYSVNLHEWTKNGGTGVKLRNGINGTKGTWTGPAITLMPEDDLMDQFRHCFPVLNQLL